MVAPKAPTIAKLSNQPADQRVRDVWYRMMFMAKESLTNGTLVPSDGRSQEGNQGSNGGWAAPKRLDFIPGLVQDTRQMTRKLLLLISEPSAVRQGEKQLPTRSTMAEVYDEMLSVAVQSGGGVCRSDLVWQHGRGIGG